MHVFISYRRQEPDNALAHELSSTLQTARHEVFIDTGIRWGADWARAIREALERTDYLLLLLSPEAAESEMVAEEVSIAVELAEKNDGRPVILAVRLNFPFSEPLPYHISAHLRTIQQETWSSAADTPRIKERLLETVGGGRRWDVVDPDDVSARAMGTGRPRSSCDPRDLVRPGGALDADSPAYVVRKVDHRALDAVRLDRGIATLRAPRQAGKTSMMMRVYAGARNAEERIRPAFVDLQVLVGEDFESLNALWRAIAVRIARQLQIAGWNRKSWDWEAEHDDNIERFLAEQVFGADDTPLLICLDEVDRVFKSPVKPDFFSSIRSFYNSGSIESIWRNVRWLLATSSEPSFFIEDLSQSPFNIGERIELPPFTRADVERFASQLGVTIDGDLSERTTRYVGGRPYLVHLLLYELARNPNAEEQLFDASTAGNGAFRDHLHRYLVHFQRDEALAEAMRSVVREQGCRDPALAYRLEAAGLVRCDEQNIPRPACELYRDFFRSVL